MPPWVPWLVGVLLAAGPSCRAKRTLEALEAPPPARTEAAPAPGTDVGRKERLEELEAELDERKRTLRALAGLGRTRTGATEEAEAGGPAVDVRSKAAPPSREMEARPPAEPEASDRCTRICDLADSICDLADRICALARRHAGDPRYEDACTGARTDCDDARAACRACT